MAEEREATPEGAGGASVDARDLDDAMEQSLASREILLALGRQGDSSDQILDTIVERAAAALPRRRRAARPARRRRLPAVPARRATCPRSSGRYMLGHPIERSRASICGRVAEDRRTQQITDVLGDPEYGRQDLQRLAGYRTLLAAPMVLGDEVVGVLTMWRTAVAPFSERDTRAAGRLRGPGRHRAAPGGADALARGEGRRAGQQGRAARGTARRWARPSARAWTPTRCSAGS